MQHSVVRAAETEAVQQTVCIAHEIAISEKQKLDQVEKRRHGIGSGQVHSLATGA